MDKVAIKTFAIESRRKLMEDVEYRMSLVGITKDGIADSISDADGIETFNIGGSATHSIYDNDIKKRVSLVREIKSKGFENVVEEVAYTWFNRIIAIRFMEVNNYLPTKTRVLSSETPGKIEPDILTNAFELDLDYTSDDKELIFKLKDENKLEELFRILFIKQCNKLNEILPNLFEKTEDYMELLLSISYTNVDGFIQNLIKTIPEEDYENVEIIGWLYQFYNSERKDKVNNALKSKPIKKEDIPAATQLFTPEWIVKYMVDNSLGRYWLERNPNSSLKEKLNYYFEEPNQIEEIILICEELRSNNIHPENLRFFDPCMGSAHILVYAFDIFMEIYQEMGYSQKEIPELIIKNNLYGLDIDKRAYQLAYFTLMMKGREYNRRFLSKNICPNVYHIKNSQLNEKTLKSIFDFDLKLGESISYLNDIFVNADEFGSLIPVKDLNFQYIESKINELLNSFENTLFDISISNEIKGNVFDLVNQAKLLSSKYHAVVTNPPYMNKYDKPLKEFSKEFYKDYSKDLFSTFMYRNFDFCTVDGFSAFMTPMTWMFIKNFEKLRKFIIDNKTFVSLIELEYHTLWEIDAHVPACTFIFSNYNYNGKYNSVFLKLSEFTGGIEVQNQKTLEAINSSVDYKFISSQSNFNLIPGSPIAYWVSQEIINTFENKSLGNYSNVITGMTTGNNNIFLKLWFEVNFNRIALNEDNMDNINLNEQIWIPYNKGGERRNWYGNNEYIVNWSLRNEFNRAKTTLKHLYLRKGLTWSFVTSAKFSARYFGNGFLWDVSGSPAFFDDDDLMYYCLGVLCTNFADYVLKLINPTINVQAVDLKKIPLILNTDKEMVIVDLVKNNIQITKNDWDDFETSWDFKVHPFIQFNKNNNLKSCFEEFESYKEEQFNILKSNEIKLNNIFSDIYSINLDSEVEDKYVSVTKADLDREVKSFISYAIGCMFGRYSLDNESLQYAGGNFNLNNYSMFIPDDDNIIPVLDTEYFEDDIVGKFIEFVKTCFGEETLEENLDFIAGTLSNSNKSSREKIRDYLLKNFFKDHVQTYKRCPIYWMFSSGKQNAFNCLIYMHRYSPDLVARVRTDYLHKTQKAIEQNIVRQENIINNSSVATEIKKATKEKNKLEKQLQETREYDEALAHIANQNIEINLDDGVKVNYAKFQNVEVNREGQKTKKINLLKKI